MTFQCLCNRMEAMDEFKKYETACIPDFGNGIVEAVVVLGKAESGKWNVVNCAGKQFEAQELVRPEDAFPWAREKRLALKEQEDCKAQMEWLLSQRACVKDLLARCGKNDIINRMSLQGRLEQIEGEIALARIRREDGEMA